MMMLMMMMMMRPPSHCWRSGEPRMLHAGPWVWVHNSRLGAFLCRWNLDHTSHRKASNPLSTNWIQVDSFRSLHWYPGCHPCRFRPPIQQCHFGQYNPRNSTRTLFIAICHRRVSLFRQIGSGTPSRRTARKSEGGGLNTHLAQLRRKQSITHDPVA